MLYAQVIVKQRTQVQELTYALSAQIIPYVRVGSLVLVPLRRRSVRGAVVGFRRSVAKELKNSIREIIKLEKNCPIFSRVQIEVIHRLASYYAAPLAEVAFHALDIVEQLPSEGLSSGAPSVRPVPLVIAGAWSQRCDAYRQILREATGRVLLIFAQHSYATAFNDLVRSSEDRYQTYLIKEFSGKKRTNALLGLLKQTDRAALVGTLGEAFFPLRTDDTIIVDQPYHLGAKSQLRPFMSSRQIGLARSSVEGLRLVLGDSVISPEDLLAVKEKKFRLQSASSVKQPLTVIDIRGRQDDALAPTLLEEISRASELGERILVLVMTRGWASALVCRGCGHTFVCQICTRTVGVAPDAKTSADKSGGQLRCAYCATEADSPKVCPNCQSSELKPIGEGVSAIENYLANRHKTISIQELSSDRPTLDNEAKITVATEKIFSFPQINFAKTFIVSADRLLSGTHLDGAWRLLGYLIELQNRCQRIVAQTYFPDSTVWGAASTGSVRPFFAQELANRRRLNLPPYGAVIAVRGSAATIAKLFAQAEKITSAVLKVLPAADISYAEVDARQASHYHGHFTIYLPRTPQASLKSKLASLLPSAWHLDID